jgi:RNA polymerase sigma factor (sigma-70 family)
MPLPPQEIEFTLDQLKAGDERAWDSAFTCLYGLAFNVLQGMNLSLQVQDLEEAAQDAIIEIINHYVATAGSVDELKRLVITIAKRKALDLLDKYGASMRDIHKTDSLNAEDSEGQPLIKENRLPSDQNSPEIQADKVERAMLLREAMKELSGNKADLLSDYYFNELSQQQLADKYAMKLSSVGGYLNRALGDLEKILKKQNLL